MKNLKLPSLTFLFFSLTILCAIAILSACTNQINDAPKVTIPEKTYTNSGLDLIQESGFKTLKAQKASWQDFHQNYLEVTSKHKNHPGLHTYISSLINQQILRNGMLNDINADNYQILETYLTDLRQMKTPYTEIHYAIINTLSPYVGKEELKTIAQLSINKANTRQEKARAEIELLGESTPFEAELKQKSKEAYEKEYHVFLPKLKTFVAES